MKEAGMNTFFTSIASLTLGCLLSLPARAQTWNVSAVSANPEPTRTGVTAKPFVDRRGAGVRFVPSPTSATGSVYLYLPVVVPTGTILRSMSFKVQGLTAGVATAELWRYPAGGGEPSKVQTLTTFNDFCTGTIFVWRPMITPHTFDNAKNAYFVRLQLTKNSADLALQYIPAVLSLGFSTLENLGATLGVVPSPSPGRPGHCFSATPAELGS